MGMSTGGSRRSRMSISEINVTPLVDVMLVLLIIFMVTAPMMKQGSDVNLPETKNSGVSTPEDPFVLSIDNKGTVFIEKTEIPIQSLSTKLKAIFNNRKEKQVFIQADKKVDYGVVAEAMAEVRAAGILKIGLITQPKN